MPKKYCHRVCLLIILINSVFKMEKNYHPKVVLEEWKHIVKEKNM